MQPLSSEQADIAHSTQCNAQCTAFCKICNPFPQSTHSKWQNAQCTAYCIIICNPCPQSKLTLHIPHCAMHIVQYTVRCGDCCTIAQSHCCKGGEKQMLQLGDALTPPSVALRILQFDLCTQHLCTALT